MDRGQPSALLPGNMQYEITRIDEFYPASSGGQDDVVGQGGLTRSEFKWNIFLVNINTLLCIEFSRGIFIAATWPLCEYLANYNPAKARALNGIFVASFSVGRLVSTTLLGYLSDLTSDRFTLILSCGISITGSLLYLFGYEYKVKPLVIASRIFMGVGAGTLSVARSHTTKITTLEQRTSYLALNGMAQYLALALAPLSAIAIQSILSSKNRSSNSSISIKDAQTIDDASSLFNSLTVPAYLLIATNILSMVLFVFFFTTKATAICVRPTAPVQQIRNDSGASDIEDGYQSHVSDTVPANSEAGVGTSTNHRRFIARMTSRLTTHLEMTGIVLFIGLNFASRAIFGLIETLGTPIFLKSIDIPSDDAHRDARILASNVLFGSMGLVGMVFFVGTIYLSRYIGETQLLLGSFGLIGMASLMMILVENTKRVWLLVGTMGLIWSVALPIKQTTLVSAFSKLIGKPGSNKGWVGAMMGWIGTAGSLGRIVMPTIAGFIPTQASFSIAFLLSTLSMALLYTYINLLRRSNTLSPN